MKTDFKKSIIIGLFISIAIIFFIIGIYIIGKQQNYFGNNLKVVAIFEDVKGLNVGDKVLFSGINIGTVSRLEIIPDNQVLTELIIDQHVMKFIKKDSKVSIENEGLMGNKILIINPGSNQEDYISEGDTLHTIVKPDINDIINVVEQAGDNVKQVSKNLIGITEKINRGDGMFGKIFTDTTLTWNLNQSSKNLTKITHDLSDISKKISAGEGIMGKLFADTSFSGKINTTSKNLKKITNNLVEITEKINKGENTFGKLFSDTTFSKDLLESSSNLRVTTKNLEQLSNKINNEENALHKFINDPDFSDSVDVLLNRLNKGVIEATKASEAIQKSGLIRMFSKDEEKDQN